MNRDRIVEIRLGGAHPHGHGKSLQRLVGPGPATCRPTMRCSGPTVTSFISVMGLRLVIAW